MPTRGVTTRRPTGLDMRAVGPRQRISRQASGKVWRISGFCLDGWAKGTSRRQGGVSKAGTRVLGFTGTPSCRISCPRTATIVARLSLSTGTPARNPWVVTPLAPPQRNTAHAWYDALSLRRRSAPPSASTPAILLILVNTQRAAPANRPLARCCAALAATLARASIAHKSAKVKLNLCKVRKPLRLNDLAGLDTGSLCRMSQEVDMSLNEDSGLYVT